MRALLLAIALASPVAQADNQNVYDFVFTGTIFPDTSPFSPPSPGAPSESFTLTFLANSPVLAFPGMNDPFSASLSAYDVNLTIGNQVALQSGTGAFAFSGTEQVGYTPGVAAFYFGNSWSFSSSALTWAGSPDFLLAFPDPLQGASFAADSNEAGCQLPGNPEVVLCSMGGQSVLVTNPTSAPEPGTWALLATGLGGLLVGRVWRSTRRRATVG